MIGQTISHYRILEKLGEGGMGIVYLAEDQYLGRRVAIKTLSPAKADHHFRARFLREARAISALSHQHIATIYDYGEIGDGRAFIVMEFISGHTLSDLMHEGKLSLSGTLQIIESVAEALGAAHERQIIHRDIKPSNIMVNERQQVKVLDFGLAKQLGAEQSQADPDARTLLATQTQSGIVVGTPLYLSPEQATGQAVDARSDLFSLGAVMYECLTGRPPFTGGSALEIGAQIIHGDPAAPSKINPNLPEELDQVVLKALAKKPAERYQSAEEFLDDLRALHSSLSDEERRLTHLFSVKRKDSSGGKRGTPRPHSLNTFSSALTTLNRTLRRPRLSLGFVLLALALAGLGLWGVMRLLRPSQHQPSAEAQRMFEIGTNALRDGAYYQASKALEQAIKIDDQYALAHARLAEAWTELDYADKAKNEMLRVNALIPDQSVLPQVDALYLDAIRAIVTRNHPQAIEAYRQISGLTPNDAHVFVDLGRAYEKNEEIGKAIESYLQATNLDAQYATAFLRLGILYGRKQEIAGALAAFDKADELYRALGVIEGRTEVHFQRGYLFNSMGQLKEARTHLQQALDLARTTDNKYQQIKSLLQLSSVSFAENSSVQAQAFAQEAVSLAQAGGMETQISRGLVDLGNIYFVRGEYLEAEKYFQQALDFAQRYGVRRSEARAQLSLGSLRFQQGKTDEAISYIEPALAFYQQGGYNKEVSLCLIVLGRASRRKGDYAGALQSYRQLLEMAQKAGDASQESLSRQGIGTVLLRQERYTEALEQFDADLSINTNRNFKLNIGYSQLSRTDALWRLGRYTEARVALDQATSIASQPTGGSKDLLAQALLLDAEMSLSERRFSEARAKAEQALALAGSIYQDVATESQRVLGLMQVRSGATRAGLASCERAMAMAARSGDPWMSSEAQLALAEAKLENGDAQGARELAQQSLESFARSAQAASEWRARLIMARAARSSGDEPLAREQAARAAELLSSLEQRWGQEYYQTYLNRPDIQSARNQLSAAGADVK